MARINRHFFVGKTGEGRLPSGTKKRLHIRLVPDMGPLHHVLKGTESFMPSDGETRRAVSLTPSSPNVPGRTRGGAHRGRAIRNRSAYSSCRPHTGRTRERGNKIRVQLITRNCQKLPIVLVVFAAILFIIPAIAALFQIAESYLRLQ